MNAVSWILISLLDSMSTSCKVSLSEKEWIDVLKVATLLHFNDYRKLAIDTLNDMIKKPVQRIMLAREHSISAWLIAGFETLIDQPTAMSEVQASLVGETTAIRLFIIRDSLVQYKLADESYSSSNMTEPEPADAQIKARFAQELRSIRDREREHLTVGEKEEEERLRASENQQQALAQLKQKIEDAKLSLAAEEKAVEQKRLALEEETKRLQEATQGPEYSTRKKGRRWSGE
jgi:hypothetical protein